MKILSRIMLIAILLLAVFTPPTVIAFDMDELLEMADEMDTHDFSDFIKNAQKEAKNWKFSNAESNLKKAQEIAKTKADNKQIEEVEKLIKSEKTKYVAEERRKEAERERELQQPKEQARVVVRVVAVGVRVVLLV